MAIACYTKKMQPILFAAVLTVSGILMGVLSQYPPQPFECLSLIEAVGHNFCQLTGQSDFLKFNFITCLVECRNDDFYLGLPFNISNPDIIIECPNGVKKNLTIWKSRWDERRVKAINDLCKK
uniref:Putative salivary secreted protein n=1 Tax=Ixodes ricinus TaxID=34613 RepID=A0A6B0UNE0_IXORI